MTIQNIEKAAEILSRTGRTTEISDRIKDIDRIGEDHEVNFDELKPLDIFFYKDEEYMAFIQRLDNDKLFEDSMIVYTKYAMRLSDGQQTWFKHDTKVRPEKESSPEVLIRRSRFDNLSLLDKFRDGNSIYVVCGLRETKFAIDLQTGIQRGFTPGATVELLERFIDLGCTGQKNK